MKTKNFGSLRLNDKIKTYKGNKTTELPATTHTGSKISKYHNENTLKLDMY